MWLCGFYYGTFHVVSCLALCSRVYSACVALCSPRWGGGGREREAVYMLLVLLFILHALNCVLFSSSWCQGLAATVLVEPLDFSINFFCKVYA